MKKLNCCIAVALLCAGAVSTRAQDRVAFEFDKNYGIPDGAPVSRMERNVENLLNAINDAASANSYSIDFQSIEIEDAAKRSLLNVWKNVHMRVLDDDIIQNCVVMKNSKGVKGYEASNIAVEMIPLDDSYRESRNQEITVTLNRDGRISDFVISMGLHQYSTLMKGAKTLEDVDQRMQILHFVEQFRTAYCEKDKKFLEDVFSDQALIITGRVREADGERKFPQVEYTKQNKKQYLAKLFEKFDRPNTYINVLFSDIEIEHNPINPKIYGVTLKQEWNSTGYRDVGIVFLLWDFTNEDKPEIYVRTWQPLQDTRRFKTTEFDI